MPLRTKRRRWRRASVKDIQARRAQLEDWFRSNEVAELLVVPLYVLREHGVIKVRKQQVRDQMAVYPRLSQREAVRDIYQAYRAAGWKVLVGDYIHFSSDKY